jgi:hypothetical protein
MQNGTNIEVTNKFDDNVIYLRKKLKKNYFQNFAILIINQAFNLYQIVDCHLWYICKG